MAKFIDVKNYMEKTKVEGNVIDEKIEVKNTILLNIEEIQWIWIKKYSNGYAILAVTNEDSFAFDCGFERENEAYEKMFELQKELNK